MSLHPSQLHLNSLHPCNVLGIMSDSQRTIKAKTERNGGDKIIIPSKSVNVIIPQKQ